MSTDAPYYKLAFKIFADFTGSIAIPAVAAALFGKWLDDKYDTQPRYLAVFLFIALFFTAVYIYKTAKKYKAEYEGLMKKDDQKP